MATFDPRMRDVQPHISITEGVQDPTLNSVLQVGWGIGKAAWQGKAQADLIGAEGHVDDVLSSDLYDAFERDESGEPVRLAFDTDLTKIANARMQGRVTGDRARALVNMRLRKAVNDNPMFAEELTQRADRFFGNVLGGGGGGSIFEPTAREQEEASIRDRTINAMVDEQNAAFEEGYTSVEERRVHKRQQMVDAQAEQQFKTSQIKNLQEITQGLHSTRTNASNRIFATLGTMQEQTGGLLDQEQRLVLTQQITTEAQAMRDAIFANRPYVDGTEADRLVSSVDRWEESLNTLANSANLEAFAETARKFGADARRLHLAHEAPVLVALSELDPSLGEVYMTTMIDPEKADLMGRLNEQFPWVREWMDRSGDNTPNPMGPMLANALLRIDGKPTVDAPSPDPTAQETVDATVAADAVAGNIPRLTPEQRENALNILHANAQDTPAVLTSLLTNSSRSWLNTNPNAFKAANSLLDEAVLGIETNMLEQGIDMDMFTIREASRRERALAAHPRGQAGGAGRHLGRTGLIIEPSPEARRQYAQSRSRRIHERGSRVEPMPDIHAIARDIQDAINVAQMYPGMELGGQPAMGYLQNLITQGLPETPWQREEDMTDRSVNEAIADIEAGSGIDGDQRYNQLVGGKNTPRQADLTDMTISEVLEYQRGMTGKGHMSSAVGKYQFIRATLNEVANQMGLDAGTTKFTPEIQEQMQTFLAQQNAQVLQRRGFDVTPSNLYLMHNLGPTSAVRLLRASPSTRADEVLTRNEIANNPGLYGRGNNIRTVGQVLAHIDRRMAGVPDIDFSVLGVPSVDTSPRSLAENFK